jgi:hypothetical protein
MAERALSGPFLAYVDVHLPNDFDTTHLSRDPWGRCARVLVLPAGDDEPAVQYTTAADELRAARLCQREAFARDEARDAASALQWHEQAERHRERARAILSATELGVVL